MFASILEVVHILMLRSPIFEDLLYSSKHGSLGFNRVGGKDLGPHHLGGRALAHFPFSGKYGGMTLVYVTII